MTAVLLASIMVAANALPIDVRGPSDCPTPAQIAALLPELLPATDDPSPDVAWVQATGQDLSITLRAPGGGTLASRRIEAAGDCAARASVAAVVIAAWKMERNPELSLLQPGVYPRAPVPPSALPSPPPAVVADPPETAARHVMIDVAAAAGASVNSAGLGGTGRVDIGGRWRAGRLGLRLAAAGDTDRSRVIEGRGVTWQRVSLGVGPSVTLGVKTAALELGARFLAGLTTVRGQGYDVDYQDRGFSPGGEAVVRLVLSAGWARPFIEAAGAVWFTPEDIAILKTDQQATLVPLPRVDARLSLGIDILLRP